MSPQEPGARLLLRGHVAARARGSCMHSVTRARPVSRRPPRERLRGGGSILGAHLAPGAWSSPPELPWRAPRRGRYGTQRSLPGDPLRHSAVLLARPVSEGLKCDAPGPSLGEADPEFDGVKRLSTRGKEKPRQVSELGKDLGDAHTPGVAGSGSPGGEGHCPASRRRPRGVRFPCRARVPVSLGAEPSGTVRVAVGGLPAQVHAGASQPCFLPEYDPTDELVHLERGPSGALPARPTSTRSACPAPRLCRAGARC